MAEMWIFNHSPPDCLDYFFHHFDDGLGRILVVVGYIVITGFVGYFSLWGLVRAIAWVMAGFKPERNDDCSGRAKTPIVASSISSESTQNALDSAESSIVEPPQKTFLQKCSPWPIKTPNDLTYAIFVFLLFSTAIVFLAAFIAPERSPVGDVAVGLARLLGSVWAVFILTAIFFWLIRFFILRPTRKWISKNQKQGGMTDEYLALAFCAAAILVLMVVSRGVDDAHSTAIGRDHFHPSQNTANNTAVPLPSFDEGRSVPLPTFTGGSSLSPLDRAADEINKQYGPKDDKPDPLIYGNPVQPAEKAYDPILGEYTSTPPAQNAGGVSPSVSDMIDGVGETVKVKQPAKVGK